MRTLDCIRCGGTMRFLMRESFQKGDSGAWVGNLSMHFRGGFEMEVYACSDCGRLEFFLPEEDRPELVEDVEIPEGIDYNAGIAYVSREGIPQVRCPKCGYAHDFDYPACPRCEHRYCAKQNARMAAISHAGVR